MFRHPNYYKNLRKLARNSELHVRPQGSEACDTDQAISPTRATAPSRRATGPGLKLPGPRSISNANKGLIHRRQASSAKLKDPQATSDKHQAPRHKRQA